MTNEPNHLQEAVREFHETTQDWNSTAEERRSTRTSMVSTLGVIPAMIDDAQAHDHLPATNAGATLFLSEAIVLLVGQIANLEERIEQLEGMA